jgi:hypothetical protein
MRRLVSILLVVALTACGDSSTGPTRATLSGTYNLTSVNGSVLPFTAQASDPKVEILGDQIVADGGGLFTENGSYRVTDAGTVTTTPITDAGTYVITGTAVVFRFDSDGSTGTGTISGNTFTVADNGLSFVYTKQ